MDETEELRKCTEENTDYATSLGSFANSGGNPKDKVKEVPFPESLVRKIKFDLIPKIQLIVDEEEEKEVEIVEIGGKTESTLRGIIEQENGEESEEPTI